MLDDGVVGDGVQHHAHVDGLQMEVERPAHLQAGHVIQFVDRGEHALAGGAEGVHLAAQPYLVDGILGLKAALRNSARARTAASVAPRASWASRWRRARSI